MILKSIKLALLSQFAILSCFLLENEEQKQMKTLNKNNLK